MYTSLASQALKGDTNEHKVQLILIPRLPEFMSLVGIGAPPLTPSPASECAPPPPRIQKGGGTHTLACGCGDGGVPIPTIGENTWYSVYSVVTRN
jgi:hypothetical protein